MPKKSVPERITNKYVKKKNSANNILRATWFSRFPGIKSNCFISHTHKKKKKANQLIKVTTQINTKPNKRPKSKSLVTVYYPVIGWRTANFGKNWHHLQKRKYKIPKRRCIKLKATLSHRNKGIPELQHRYEITLMSYSSQMNILKAFSNLSDSTNFVSIIFIGRRSGK